MTKNTGMTAKDEKAGKSAKLPVAKTNALNKTLKEHKTAPHLPKQFRLQNKKEIKINK